MATDVKAVLKVEGEQSFASAFKNATSSVKALDTAVKANQAAFENTGDKMQSLQEKSSLLRQEISAQENVVKLANEELKRLKDEYGEGSTQVNNYQAKVNTATAKLEQMKTALADTDKEMNNLGKRFEETGKKLTAVGDKVSALGSKMKWLSAGATAALTGMFNAASDLNENMNKTEVVFGDLSDEIAAWSKTTLDSFGIAQSSALEMSSYFGDMATSMGLTTEQAAAMGKELVGRAGDLASFKNVSLDVARTGLGAIFTGETESLKRFGVVMTEANLQAYALAQGFEKQYKEMDQAEKVMLRYQYVMDATKNSAGDFINTSDGAANSVRVAKESLKEAAATLGEEVIPLVVPLIQNVTELIKGVNALDDGTKNLIVSTVGVIAIAAPVLKIGGSIIKGIGWIAGTGLPALTGAAGTAGTAGAAAGTAIAGGMSAAAVATGGLIALMGALAIAAGAAIAKLKEEEQIRKNIEAKSANTANRRLISADQVQYYNPSDYIAYGYGDSTEYWLRNGAQMTTQGRRDWLDNQRELDSVGGTTNNYNFDVNVSQVSDLQDLLNMANTAQLYNRMGVAN